MNLETRNTTATSTTLRFSSIPAGTLAIDVQYCDRPDFMWTLAPVIRSNGTDDLVLNGLNQAQNYFFRARPISVAGVEGAWSSTVGLATPLKTARNLSPASVMIEPAIIVAPEPVLSWTAQNEQPGFPARALGRDDPNSTWRAARIGQVYAFEAELARTQIDTIAILATNASENATVTIKGGWTLAEVRSENPAFVIPSQRFRASENLPGRRGYHAFIRLPGPYYSRFWRVEIGGDIPGDLFVATYAVFGKALFTKNYATDSKGETIADYGSIERDRSGNPNRVTGHRGRQVEFQIAQMREAQYEEAYEQLRWKVGTTDPVLVLPNSKPGPFLHDRLLYGQLRASQVVNTFSPLFTHPFTIDSLI